MTDPQPPAASSRWAVAPVAAALPFVLALSWVLWRSPIPLSESIGIFEDVDQRPVTDFLLPSTAYYRPLFQLTLSALWHGAPSLEVALAAIKIVLDIVPAAALLLLFAAHLRPRTAPQAAASLVALAAVIGAPGFLGNLELPLAQTVVGMPFAMGTWMLLERQRSRAGDVAIVGFMLVAVGFKEQGLAVAPLVVVAWWMRAPGAGRGTAVAAIAIAATYVVFRLAMRRADLPMFEQMIGYGFEIISPSDAASRWGGFPLPIYAYNALATMGTVLFAEPTEGIFRFVRAFVDGGVRPWHAVYLGSSAASTALVAWWGVGAIRQCNGRDWSPAARVFVAAIVAVAASGALSFAYSRERLSGMAVPFYALALYWAVAAAADRIGQVRRHLLVAVATTALVLLSAAWSGRALYTIEFTRQRAVNAQREWLTDLGSRRERLHHRAAYLRIMEALRPQGVSPHGLRRAPYPRWLYTAIGEY